ncbi:MAG: methylated-DNA--[protein]-cysteine S-methyltransferase [Solirubrobacteraceae bacterium]
MSSTICQSPLGALTLVGDAQGLREIHFPGHGPTVHESPLAGDALAGATEQLEAYFAGERRDFDFPLDVRGTVFQRRVWAALTRIPYGTTTTYGTLARELGAEARAVAGAIARTPVPIVIPCHRVVGANGSLTGYRGGLHRKRALLDFEAAGGQPAALQASWRQRQLALL